MSEVVDTAGGVLARQGGPGTRRIRAELVEDGGASAAEPGHFFRSPDFLRAEGATHSLVLGSGRLGSGRIVLPLVCRPIPGGGVDGVSPYGFPGGRVEADGPVPSSSVDFSHTGVVSLFLRDRAAAPVLSGGDARGRLLIFDPAGPRTVSRRLLTKARSTERAGYRVDVLDGTDVDDADLAGFADVYRETMRHVGASERYFFDDAYLRASVRTPASRLVLVRGPEADVAAAAILVRSDGMLHYFLGGSAERHRCASPAKNMMLAMMDVADGAGVPLNFGGGVTPGDALHRFKAGFANAEIPFRTHSVVVDRPEYERLAEGRTSDFFPAYRS